MLIIYSTGAQTKEEPRAQDGDPACTNRSGLAFGWDACVRDTSRLMRLCA